MASPTPQPYRARGEVESGEKLTDDSKHGRDYEENEDGVQDRLQRAEDPVHNLPHFLIFSGAFNR